MMERRKRSMWQKCPICEGHGIVPSGFYSMLPGYTGNATTTATEICKTCGGAGIIKMPLEN